MCVSGVFDFLKNRCRVLLAGIFSENYSGRGAVFLSKPEFSRSSSSYENIFWKKIP